MLKKQIKLIEKNGFTQVKGCNYYAKECLDVPSVQYW